MFGYATCLASCSSLCADELVEFRRQLLPLCWLLLWLLWQLWLLLLWLLLLRLLAHLLLLWLLWQLWLLLLWLLWQLWLLWLLLRVAGGSSRAVAPVAAFAPARLVGPLFFLRLLLYLKHRCDRCEMLLQDVGRALAVLRRHFRIGHNILKVFDLHVIQREWYTRGQRHRGRHARRAREVCSARTCLGAQLLRSSSSSLPPRISRWICRIRYGRDRVLLWLLLQLWLLWLLWLL
jgi:hypothetical protein